MRQRAANNKSKKKNSSNRAAGFLKSSRQVKAEQSPPRRVSFLAVTFGIVMTVVMGGLLVRVATLQTNPPAPLEQQFKRHVSTETIQGRRGALLDRRDRPLAVTREARTLFIDPKIIEDRGVFSTLIYQHLGYDPAVVEMAMAKSPKSRYIVIDRMMDPPTWRRYQEMPRIPGLATHPITVRAYPFGSVAGQIVGFVSQEGEGLDGLELAMQQRLAPDQGHMAFLRDRSRKPLWVEPAQYQPPRDGQSVRLSLDMTIQAIAERHLQNAVNEFNAESGQVVVMNPQTGEILAMANFPFFDPSAKRPQGDQPERRNRAVTDAFEPGSIFKPIVWAGLLELGATHSAEKIDTTTSGYHRFDFGRTLRDAHPQGLIDWDTVLIKSSNIGMALVAMRVSDQELHDMIRSFGFGSPTGSGIPGEIQGIVTTQKNWTKYSQTSVPMGQEIGVTAIQMVRGFAAIANDGKLVRPTIEAIDPNDPVKTVFSKQVISPEVARHTRDVLARVVTEGTGRKARSDLYPIFGKTGTAQLPDLVNGGYYEDQYVSSFIAGAPVDQPRIIVGCFVHRPDKSIGHYGGIVSAPAVKQIIEETLMYLGTPANPEAPQDVVHLVANRMTRQPVMDHITAEDVAE